MEQRAANGSSPVLIKEGKSIPRDVFLKDSGKAMSEHTRGFGGEGGEDSGRRLTPEHGASSMLLFNP